MRSFCLSFQKIKKSLGPEFEALPYGKKARKTGERGMYATEEGSSESLLLVPAADQVARCDFCLKGAECNRLGLPEDLLICKDCFAKG